MKRFVAVMVLLLAVPVVSSAQDTPAGGPQVSPTSAGPVPVIEVDQKIADMGVVAKGEKVKATFTIKNVGKAPLEISQVRPTCGCTVASFDKNIPPGGTGSVVAEVDTSAFNGPISKAVLVFSNDPETPQINLAVKAEVRAFIEVLPRSLLRFNVLQGEPATEKVILASAEIATFKILATEVSGGAYDIKFRELAENERIESKQGSQWEVKVTIPANAPEGMLNHKIVVKTDAPKAPEVTLNVSGLVRPIVQIVPAEVNFGTIPSDAPVGRNVILINNRSGAELQLTKAEVDDPAFATEVIPLQAGQRYQVAVSLPAGVAKGTHKATLKITTNDPSRGLIQVPILAIVQ